jgi:hypothetical protein
MYTLAINEGAIVKNNSNEMDIKFLIELSITLSLYKVI